MVLHVCGPNTQEPLPVVISTIPNGARCVGVERHISGAGVQLLSRNRETPFHCLRNMCHILRSSLQSVVRWTWWCNSFARLVTSNNLEMKERPDGMTLASKLKWPNKLRASLFVQRFRHRKVLTKATKRVSLSWGSLASIFCVSRITPKYSRVTVGPTVLCCAMGTPSLAKIVVSRAMVRSASAAGLSIVRKSSSKWKICGMQ